MGKSSFALTIACNIAEIHDLPTCFFNLNDFKENLTRNFITYKTGFNNGRLNNGEFSHKEKSILDYSIQELGKLPIDIFDNPLVSISEIYQICRDIKKEIKDKKLGLVVIEELQSLEYYKLNISEEESKNNIAKKLKSLAEELCVPLIITSEIIKDVELRENKIPQIYDLTNF